MQERTEFWTPLGVRLRRARCNPGELDWLFLPGGPGIGSESLAELVQTADLPGRSWLVDLPGDGSNVSAPGAPSDPYSLWPHVFLEAAAAFDRPVAVGHSTGGQYLLSIPHLEHRLRGVVLISSAPDAGWMPQYEAMTKAHPLPAVQAASRRYELDPSDAALGDVAVASAPWNFDVEHVDIGARLLARMPYNMRAVEWSAAVFDTGYIAAWWPVQMPTLIVSGRDDRIVTQQLWLDPRYRQPNVTHRWVERAGHWPWIEQPAAVRSVLRIFADQIVDDQGRTVPAHQARTA